MKLPLVKGTRASSSAEWRDSLPVNMVGFFQSIGDWTGYLRTADGLKQYATGVGADRGGIWSDRFKKHYRLSGDKFVEVGQFGDVTELSATSVPGSNRAPMANSFNSIAFVANGDYYHWDGSTLTTPTPPVGSDDFIDIVWVDGYYIFTDGENLWNTTLANETLFNANERDGSDFAPDEIVGVGKGPDGKLIAFNRYTIDRFTNTPGTPFPFTRIPGASIPIGIVGTNAKVRLGDGRWVIFGGSKEYSPSFYLLTNSYTNISTKEIDSIIDTYSDYELVNINLEFRDTRDQRLVICHLPRHTLVYDIKLSESLGQSIWYEWNSGSIPWRARNGVYDPRNVDNDASGWIYGDSQGSTIGRLDSSICTQYGELVVFECATPLVKAAGAVDVAEIVTAPGHSSVNGDQVFVSTTKDGVLYGPEILLNRGNLGDYQHRTIIRRLGDYPRWFGMKIRGKSAGVYSVAGIEINEI